MKDINVEDSRLSPLGLSPVPSFTPRAFLGCWLSDSVLWSGPLFLLSPQEHFSGSDHVPRAWLQPSKISCPWAQYFTYIFIRKCQIHLILCHKEVEWVLRQKVMLLCDITSKSHTVKALDTEMPWATSNGSHFYSSRMWYVRVPPSDCEFWLLKSANSEKAKAERKTPLSLASTSRFNLENQRELEKDFFCNYPKISILCDFRLQTRKRSLMGTWLHHHVGEQCAVI